LSEEVDPQAFVAEMKSIAAFLSSIPDRTMRAGGSGHIFLDIRASTRDTDYEFDSEREDDSDEESSPFKYRAAFALHRNNRGRSPGWSFSLAIDVRRRLPGVPANEDRTHFNQSYDLVDVPR
jgi:hypothetical protein